MKLRDADVNRAGKDGAPGHQIRHMSELPPLSPNELDDRRIIHAATPNREALNTFRELRTQLLQRGGKENFVVLVTSVSEGGGASFVALNLAAAFALDNAKTALLVDCNFYAPAVEKLLFVQHEYGLTDYLDSETIDADEIIYASGIPRLRIIPVGHQLTTGTEYYSSARMEHFVADVRTRYADRYVVIDAPPVGIYPDSRILADLCDFVLLVVPYGKVTQEQVQAAVDALPEQKLLGIVFNNG